MGDTQTIKIGNVEWYILKTIGSRYFLLAEQPLYKGYYSLQPCPYIDSKIAQFINTKFVQQLGHRGVDLDKINNTSILTAGQYKMYVKDKLPNTSISYMLQTAHPTKSDCILAVNSDGELYPALVRDSCGIRPCMFIDKSYADIMSGKSSEDNEEIAPDPKFANFVKADEVQPESNPETPETHKEPENVVNEQQEKQPDTTESHKQSIHIAPMVSVVRDMIPKRPYTEMPAHKDHDGTKAKEDKPEITHESEASVVAADSSAANKEISAPAPVTDNEHEKKSSDVIMAASDTRAGVEETGCVESTPSNGSGSEPVKSSIETAEDINVPAHDQVEPDNEISEKEPASGIETEIVSDVVPDDAKSGKNRYAEFDEIDSLFNDGNAGNDILLTSHTEEAEQVEAEEAGSTEEDESVETVSGTEIAQVTELVEESGDSADASEAEEVKTESKTETIEEQGREAYEVMSAMFSDSDDVLTGMNILEENKTESEVPEACITAGEQTIEVTQVGNDGNTHAVYLFNEEEFKQYAVLYEGGEKELREVMNEYGIAIYDFLRSSVNENRKVVTRADVMKQVQNLQKKWRWREK